MEKQKKVMKRFLKSMTAVFLLAALIFSCSLPVTAYADGLLDTEGSSTYKDKDGKGYDIQIDKYGNVTQYGKTPESPGIVEKGMDYLCDLVVGLFTSLAKLVADGIYNILNDCGILLDNIIFGRVGGHGLRLWRATETDYSSYPLVSTDRYTTISPFAFELEQGNPYGVVASIIYKQISSYMYIGIAMVVFLKMVMAFAKNDTKKAVPELGGVAANCGKVFVLVAGMPYVLEVMLYIRDVLLKGVVGGSMMTLFNSTDIGLVEVFKANAEAEGAGFISTLIYLGAAVISLSYAAMYVGMALQLTVHMIAFPFLCLRALGKPDVFGEWFMESIGIMAMPLIDGILFMVPLAFNKLAAGNLLLNIISLLCCTAVMTARTQFKNSLGIRANTGMETAMLMNAMGAASLARGIGGAVKGGVGRLAGGIAAGREDAKMEKVHGELAANEKSVSGSSGNTVEATTASSQVSNPNTASVPQFSDAEQTSAGGVVGGVAAGSAGAESGRMAGATAGGNIGKDAGTVTGAMEGASEYVNSSDAGEMSEANDKAALVSDSIRSTAEGTGTSGNAKNALQNAIEKEKAEKAELRRKSMETYKKYANVNNFESAAFRGNLSHETMAEMYRRRKRRNYATAGLGAVGGTLGGIAGATLAYGATSFNTAGMRSMMTAEGLKMGNNLGDWVGVQTAKPFGMGGSDKPINLGSLKNGAAGIQVERMAGEVVADLPGVYMEGESFEEFYNQQEQKKQREYAESLATGEFLNKDAAGNNAYDEGYYTQWKQMHSVHSNAYDAIREADKMAGKFVTGDLNRDCYLGKKYEKMHNEYVENYKFADIPDTVKEEKKRKMYQTFMEEMDGKYKESVYNSMEHSSSFRKFDNETSDDGRRWALDRFKDDVCSWSHQGGGVMSEKWLKVMQNEVNKAADRVNMEDKIDLSKNFSTW